MDLSNPFFIDMLWLSIAFGCGMLAKRAGLAPLIGFLLAGFVLNFFGLGDGHLNDGIELLSDIGVLLLLFTIGLKLKIRSLLRPKIWATASIHMVISVALIGGLMFLLSWTGLALFSDLDWKGKGLISFALSFSSTVFVVKTLETRGEFNAAHGQLAIGILIIQDIFAVIFIALTGEESPSIWLLALPVILYALRWVLGKLLEQLEHGELIPLFGFFATFVAGAFSFSLIGLKPDLGALVMGVLLAGHPKAGELYDRMVGFKDFFLVAFFLNVGFTGLPTLQDLGVALLILPLFLLKGGLFWVILSRFRLQRRTLFLGALSLTNYSEFGLIVGVVGLEAGWIPESWVIIIALVLSFSYVIASFLFKNPKQLYFKFQDWWPGSFEGIPQRRRTPMKINSALHLVVGMGEVGREAYKSLEERNPGCVIGLDYDLDKVEQLRRKDFTVKWVDTAGREFWQEVDLSSIKSIFLTMPNPISIHNTMYEINRVREQSDFKVFAISNYADQAEKLRDDGVDYVFNYQKSIGKDLVDNAEEEFVEVFS